MKPISPSPAEDDRVLLSTLAPSQVQRRLALAVALGLAVALAATAPFATLPTRDTEALLPAYAAAVLVIELITAALLFAMYAVQRSQGLLILAVAYLFSGLMVIPWGLTFPGVFAPSGLLDAGLQSTATLAAARRIGFPLLLLLYSLMPKDAGVSRRGDPARPSIVLAVVAVVTTVCGTTALAVAGETLLPQWMADTRQVATAWHFVPPIAVLLCLASAASLVCKRSLSVLDLWLLIVLLATVIEIALLAYLSASRFSLGWWAGRLYGLTASSVVLLVLLSETVALYVRLARSLMAERRSREAKLSTLEILSASIAHEVNQPLGSMVTNAEAALRWMDRQHPDLGEARAALQRIAKDGHRAGKVIQSVRTMFKKDLGERVSFDLNALLAAALDRSVREARPQRLEASLDLDAGLPRLVGDPLRLGQVAANLLGNAVEAMTEKAGQPATLRVSTRLTGPGSVVVSVQDSGPGLTDEARQRLFEPFFTTKSEGLGMGLVFCRSVVESHGGRLWADDNPAGGAIFRFTLPLDDESDQRG